MIRNHYGLTIDSDVAITGVVANNKVEWLGDELFGTDAIDLAWEEHLKECPGDDRHGHDFCGPQEQGTVLIGSWKKDADGKYEEDREGEYAAIVGETNTQVVWSRVTTRARLCSPCYPGQADLDSPDPEGFLAYRLPYDLMGDKEVK